MNKFNALLAGLIVGCALTACTIAAQAQTALLQTVNKDNIDRIIYQLQTPVVVLAIGGSCGECQEVVAIIQEQAIKRQNVKFVIADADTFDVPGDLAPLVAILAPPSMRGSLTYEGNVQPNAAAIEAFLAKQLPPALRLIAADKEREQISKDVRVLQQEVMTLFEVENPENFSEQRAQLFTRIADGFRRMAELLGETAKIIEQGNKAAYPK